MKGFQLEYIIMAGSINKSMRVRECEKCPGNSKYLSLNRSLVLEREGRGRLGEVNWIQYTESFKFRGKAFGLFLQVNGNH